MIGVVAAVLSLLSATTLPERAGCLPPKVVRERVQALRNAEWTSMTRSAIAALWPKGMVEGARDVSSNEVVELVRQGRVIDGRLDCGESYLFQVRPSTPERLVEVTYAMSGYGRAEAGEVARALAVHVIGASQPTMRSGTTVIDGGIRDVVEDHAWISGATRNTLQIVLDDSSDAVRIVLTWRRDPSD